MDWTDEIDARGLLCPLPVLRARKRLLALRPGAVLRVLADDPAARIDMPHFCAEAGHALIGEADLGPAGRAYLIRRDGGRRSDEAGGLIATEADAQSRKSSAE